MRAHFLAVAALLAAGCDGNSGGGENEAASAAAAGAAYNGSGDTMNLNFTVRNESRVAVTHVSVSPSAANTWGEDLLRRNVVPPGENAQVTFNRGQNGCSWDVKVRAGNGSEHVIGNADLCRTAEVAFR